MIEMINNVGRWSLNRSLGLLFVRIAVGMVFFMHGWMKIHNMPMIEGFFGSMGLPAWTATFIAWLEIVGGIAIVLGVLTRWFAKLFVIEMLVAIYLTGHFGNGYQPHELELALLFASLGLLFTGSGRYSLWAGECFHCGAMKCDTHAKTDTSAAGAAEPVVAI